MSEHSGDHVSDDWKVGWRVHLKDDCMAASRVVQSEELLVVETEHKSVGHLAAMKARKLERSLVGR